jgi:hypothetical protein
MTQTTGGSPWTESGSVAESAVVPIYLVADGADVTISLTGPERFAFYDPIGLGDYTLLDLTPVFLVDDGSGNAVPSNSGPAAFVLADGGSGDIELTTDLSLESVADLYYDTGGDLWLVRRSCKRLHAVQIGSAGVAFY